MAYEPFMDWKIAAARGLNRISCIHKFGQTPAATTTFETVWAGSGNLPYPSTAMTVRIVSDSANDASAGTGAVNVVIEGLNASMAVQTATVELTGVTPVTITAAGTTAAMQFKRIYRAWVNGASAGALNDGKLYVFDNAGTVTAGGVPTSSTDIFAVVASDTNQTLQAAYTVPGGHVGYLMNWNLNADNKTNDIVDYQILARKFESAGGTATNNPLRLQESGVMGGFSVNHTNSLPVKYSGTTDIEFRCKSSASGALVNASFEVLLVRDGGE